MLSKEMQEYVETRKEQMLQKGATKEVVGNIEVFRTEGPEGQAILKVLYEDNVMVYYSYKETSETSETSEVEN